MYRTTIRPTLRLPLTVQSLRRLVDTSTHHTTHPSHRHQLLLHITRTLLPMRTTIPVRHIYPVAWLIQLRQCPTSTTLRHQHRRQHWGHFTWGHIPHTPLLHIKGHLTHLHFL